MVGTSIGHTRAVKELVSAETASIGNPVAVQTVPLHCGYLDVAVGVNFKVTDYAHELIKLIDLFLKIKY